MDMQQLAPEKVFHYFRDICNIPHGSGNVDAISDYLVDFAKAHGLWVKQDEMKNVIMIKEASAGRENSPALMIQGHMDMVAVKDATADIDLTKEPLRLAVDGDFLYAEDTSLGGDDGIAIAYGLALLDDADISMPRMELVITTDEEVGMEGATAIDLSPCEAMMMLNIDSEEEGEFVAACAGGVRVNGSFKAEMLPFAEDYYVYEVILTGFAGGHSGTEIDKKGANANKVMGYFLGELDKATDMQLGYLKGGEKDNAIPVEAEAVIGIKEEQKELFEQLCAKLEAEIKQQYKETDPECKLLVSRKVLSEKEVLRLSDGDKTRLLAFLNEAQNGVTEMSRELPGLVQTSLNLGIMEWEENVFRIAFSLRSSVAEEKDALKKTVCELVEKHGGNVSVTGEYPAWEYKADSPLREHMLDVFEKQYGRKPKVLSLHAGLECGILAAKKPGLDCVSFGPDILDIHTTRERMSISSVQRTWKFLREVVETL